MITRFLVLICLTIPVGASPAIAQSTIGNVVAVDDTVTGSRGGSSRKLATGSQIFAKELIKANASGLGQFEFLDGTRMVVGPGSTLALDSLIYDAGGSGLKKFALTTASGAFRFISGSGDSSAYQIDTPVGSLGIRGTAFDLYINRGRAYVMLVEGAVEFCTRSGNCKTLKRRCDYFVANHSGKISDPVLPRNGIFSGKDMAQYFPFVADQRPLQPDFRLKTQFCGGGAGTGGSGGAGNASGNIGGSGTFSGPSGGGNEGGGDPE